ncbi:MAG TPA: sulfotransferase family 2 domain-containing protein [Saprospiraceae bacterium]|nr:sulfotransferase family 2 domain-containing protein [Saprospiraceae bacterium]MCB9327421.1 sulfotransferase family 2 domain-containing protein [Lewinellaceae bacterium]HPK09415.1 sulfotransferase family 2 domain-containing protein [Saprospiraceae bacterium]HPQ20915.1 sulfotransferase family 2 domain-containing protein [Saprospiraceae bacterium]HRX28424.1 sulfotransferase family 2 domain-containing protein [Saprospiraceae bacterium]
MRLNYNKLINYKFAFSGVNYRKADWNSVQLISIHIPKTAGTSFLKTLRDEYQYLEVVRMDLHHKNESLINMVPINDAFVSKQPKVIHGHFKISELEALISLPKQYKLITWLRNPVERVISNYYYLSKRLHEELDEKKRRLNILAKMEKSLIEYASLEMNRNRMSKFLAGLQLEDFDFIGIVENYEDDLILLSELMGWQATKKFTVNKTGSTKKQVPDELQSLIAELNRDDMQLYQQALAARKNR